MFVNGTEVSLVSMSMMEIGQTLCQMSKWKDGSGLCVEFTEIEAEFFLTCCEAESIREALDGLILLALRRTGGVPSPYRFHRAP